jgi:hypothetical protein
MTDDGLPSGHWTSDSTRDNESLLSDVTLEGRRVYDDPPAVSKMARTGTRSPTEQRTTETIAFHISA